MTKHTPDMGNPRAIPARHGPSAPAATTPTARTGLSPAEIRQIILEILG